VHGGVGLEGGQAQVAALGLEGDGVSDNVPQSKTSLQFAVIDVAIFAQVNVEQAIEPEALQVANETGRDNGDVTLLCHDSGLDIVEFQAGMVPHHRTYQRHRGDSRKLSHFVTAHLLYLLGFHTKYLVPGNKMPNIVDSRWDLSQRTDSRLRLSYIPCGPCSHAAAQNVPSYKRKYEIMDNSS